MKTFSKDALSTLDYVWDWTTWLDSDTITDHQFIVPVGMNYVSSIELSGEITVWLSGGVSGLTYIVTCIITTALGRNEPRSAIFVIEPH